MFSGRGRKDSGGAGDRPTPTGRLLQSLYGRSRGNSNAPHSNSASSLSSPSSSAHDSTRADTAGYSMLGNLRRAEPQPTVELARPATEAEFSRTSDAAYSVFDRHALSGSASLMALRATQQGPGFADNVHTQSPHILDQGSDGDGLRSGSTSRAGFGAERVGAGGDNLFGRRMSLMHGEAAGDFGIGSDSMAPWAYFNDERDVPFRLNAVEIAAQDDKNECAFLSHHFEPNSALGSEYERARSILPLLVGQLHPEIPSSLTLLAPKGRLLEKPVASSGLREELDVIQAFNHRACQRLRDIDPYGVMSEFALCHLRRIIRQLLEEIDIDESRGWDPVVFNMAMNAVKRVKPNVKVQPNVRGGDSMDLRRYVRIKRIPGGTPSDSQYISGIVFTKNLAHRRMPRYLVSPQIMLLTFPLEYTSPSKYVLFDDELRVQQGFTEKLVQRITGAAPDIVLAEKHVPRQVLEGLMRNKICVAYGVKRSVIRAISRCTGAEIVTSIDKFSDYPRTGVCESIAVQTYEDESLPEFRKSFIFLDGCIDNLGGTIVLRGETFDKLGDIKQVVDLVVCMAYSMNLESSLLLNEFALAAPGKYELTCAIDELPTSNMVSSGNMVGSPSDSQSLALQALSEYTIVLSSSPCVRIPPPHVLVCMREKELAIGAITEKFNKLTKAARRDPYSVGNGDELAAHSAHSTGVSFLVSRQQSAAGSNRMRQQYESELALHESHIHEGEAFLETNPQAVSLWDYQSIVVAYIVTCRKHDYLVCAGPQYHSIAFYGHTDVTLGQYLEEMCFDLHYDCPSNNRLCPHPMYEHRRSYIHHHGKIDVTMDEYPCPIERMSEEILMWGECRLCHKSTPVTRMSDESWRYSFGKYLETTFYNDTLTPRACVCPHDIHRDYVRCFTLRNMVVKFEYSAFPIWSIATPTTPLYFNMEVSIRLKEEEARELRKRLDDYYASLASRLEAFPLELVFDERIDECKRALSVLAARAATEQIYFQQTLEQTLRNTHPADTLVIVVVYVALQDKVVEWNLQFSELVQSFIQLDASSRAISASKRVMSSEALSGGDIAPPKGALPPLAKVPKTDSLEIIDELHSAAHHYDYVPGDAGAQNVARFDMPHISTSPSAELSAASLLAADSADTSLDSPLMSRLHRRLSMEMMRQERERQEKLQEKLRRTAEFIEGRIKGMRQVSKAGAASAPPLLPPRQYAHPNDASRVADYSTTRLIGGVATDIDEDVRVTRQTEFPELRGRRGKSKTKYAAGYGSKDAQPLFDILQQPDYAHYDPGPASKAPDTAKDASQLPTRIPGIRSQQAYTVEGLPDNALVAGSGRRSTAGSRPLSSFGKPPDTRNSNIPRPPNIRGRATSPTGADSQNPTASAPASHAATAGNIGGGEEQHKGSSNVFLRLAKRLNSAKGNQSSSSILGTAPRKMNLLLPAAAQYMSQQPRRPTTPQVQVFYTKPSPSEESAARKSNSSRRHSYQVPPDGSSATALANSPTRKAAGSSRSRQISANRRGSAAHSSISAGITEEFDDDDDELKAEDVRYRELWPSSSSRRRSATVTRVSTDDGRGRGTLALDYPPVPPPSQSSHVVQSAGPASQTADGVPAVSGAASKPSVASRASNIIPSITRRLGLGFGFRSNVPRNPSGKHGNDTTVTTDDDGHATPALQQKQRPMSTHVVDSKGARAPIPAQLVIDRNAKQDAMRRPGRRRISGAETSSRADAFESESSSGTESSSTSSSISIDTSGDSDSDAFGGVDDHLPYRAENAWTPSSNRPRSGWHSYAQAASTDNTNLSIGTPDTHLDLLMSSPMRTTHNSSLQGRSRARLTGGLEDSADGATSGSVRASMFESTRQPRLHLRRDSSTEDDDLDTHEPDLHFGQSDTGSDAENIIGSVSEQDSKAAADYLHSVITTTGAQAAAAGHGSDYTREPSTASASTPAIPGQVLTKIGSIESSLDTGTGGVMSGSGDSTAAISLPQENLNKLWKTISKLLMAPGSSQLFQIGIDLKYPLDPTEHVVAGSPIIVRESEPSSIIAFTLMTSQYREEIHTIFERAKEYTGGSGDTRGAGNNRDGRNSVDSSLFGSGEPESKSPVNEFAKPEPHQLQDEDAIIERVMMDMPGHHPRFEFAAEKTKFVCEVFYIAQFEALRRCNGCEGSYIESLSRCMPYIAQGGKSGSAFLRTRDKRFIIKEVLNAESEAFLKFAPFYFKHMYRTYRDVLLTVLVKIFGFCRVSYRNARTKKWVEMNVIIMENLFYERTCKPTFDLKGSERNRMVDETGLNEVLQDENFVKLIRKNPLCIRQQTKRHLHDAIWNDTLFLSKMNVMDYSLLVGVDERNNELVIGIVDFIRTFTWDKKLESWVKEASILGGGGKSPTIVSPKQYKKRFREAMERYFLMVPDKFFILQAAEEED
ncbi:Mitochondrial distribution and morphology protein 12 [Coemansia aciculifera]|uniref:1-phosphatidylinositol-3-phosphate 5-kinase n=1 Tax=Coemansia aciculifera TaxID=417176 RepID=A0A9W8III5_9FUNG|nr:Mitochondrial distribution and morphology protein 12 [Coemansia aciculifera]